MMRKGPPHPYAVLLLATLLAGGGHVLAGQPQRGFGFALFTLVFAVLSWHTTGTGQSFVGRIALGLFVWAISIPDAYRLARTHYARWQRGCA